LVGGRLRLGQDPNPGWLYAFFNNFKRRKLAPTLYLFVDCAVRGLLSKLLCATGFRGRGGKAYYLMSIHEHLPPQARKQLKEVGWANGLQLAKLARRDRQHFDCATWLHRAREIPKSNSSRKSKGN